ncbi:hypothetical protein JCM5353_008703 [Sporobolomyces roseus]
MSHGTMAGWTNHALTQQGFAKLKKSIQTVNLDTQRLVPRAGGSTGGHASAAMEEMALWNDISAKNLNLLVGCLLLLGFLASLPRWIDFFAARGKGFGWSLTTVARSTTTQVSNHLDEKEYSEKKQDVKIKVKQSCRARLPGVVPTGAFTLRLRTFQSSYLIRPLALPFSVLSHLSLGKVLVCLVYQAIVIFCLFYHCTDHKTNWRRSGYIAVAQLPAVFLAASKNGIGFLLGSSYEKFNYLHRVAGRLVMLASLLHALLFLRKTGWEVDWQSDTHVTGIVAVLALSMIFISSLKPVRDAFYQFFLVCHILGFVTFLIAVQLHVPSTARPYTLACLFNYVFDLFLRIIKTRITTVSLAPLAAETTMIQSNSLNDGWRAGQHVFVRVWTWRRWFESHPFSIAVASSAQSPLDSNSHKLTLLAKSCGGFTRSLYDQSTSGSTPLSCTIEGPYGHPLSLNFASYQSVLLFAGGSGITYCASIFEELVGKAARGESMNRDIMLVWSMRDLESLEWYRSLLASLLKVVELETSLSVSIYLHITATADLPSISPIPCSYLSSTRPNPASYLSRSISTALHSLTTQDTSNPRGFVLPNGGGLGVGVGGPGGLGNRVREAISKVGKERALKVGGIVLHEETFGW